MSKKEKNQSNEFAIDYAEKLSLAYKIVNASPLFSQFLTELSPKGFPFDLKQSQLAFVPENSDFVHLSLRDTRTSLNHDVADIFLTIDLKRYLLVKGEYMVTQKRDKGLDTFIVISVGKSRKQLNKFVSVEELNNKIPQNNVLDKEKIVPTMEGCSPSSWTVYDPWYGDSCHSTGICNCNGKQTFIKCKFRVRTRSVTYCHYYNRSCNVRCDHFVTEQQVYQLPCMVFNPLSCREV